MSSLPMAIDSVLTRVTLAADGAVLWSLFGTASWPSMSFVSAL